MQALAFQELPVKKVSNTQAVKTVNCRALDVAHHRTRQIVQMIMLIAITLFSLLYLVECVKGLSYYQSIKSYSDEQTELSKLCKIENDKIEQLTNLHRIEKVAREMGMVYPGEYRFLDFSKNRLSMYSR